MSTETLGWILVAAPFVLIWLVAFFIDPFASFVILFVSAAAGVMAGIVAYGLMLTGVF